MKERMEKEKEEGMEQEKKIENRRETERREQEKRGKERGGSVSSISHIATTVTLWRVGSVVSTFLPHERCQSRIDGRIGSSACTVIATLVARDILHQDLVTADGHSVVLKQALLQQFVKCIHAGNCLYDE